MYVFCCCFLKSWLSYSGSRVLLPIGHLDCCAILELPQFFCTGSASPNLGAERGSPLPRTLSGRKEMGWGALSPVTSVLTSFCSSRGRASVSRVIQKEQGAMWAVINIKSNLAASENRFSPYSRWNSRYLPTHGCWWRVKGISVCQTCSGLG